MGILGVSLYGIALGGVRIVAHGLLFTLESSMAAVASVRPAVLLELTRFYLIVRVRAMLGSVSTATVAESATAFASAFIVIASAVALLASLLLIALASAATSASTVPPALVVGVTILLVWLLVWLLIGVGGNRLLQLIV